MTAMRYRTLFVARHYIPEDRLAHVSIDQEGAMAFALKARKVHPAVLPELAELSDGIGSSGIFDFDPAGAWSDIGCWYIRAPLGDKVMEHRIVGTRPMFFEILLNEDLISEEVVRELNVEVMPRVCAALHWAIVPEKLA